VKYSLHQPESWPAAWNKAVWNQTWAPDAATGAGFRLLGWGLPAECPPLSPNLVEQLGVALWAHPTARAIVAPLYVSARAGAPAALVHGSEPTFARCRATGGLALVRESLPLPHAQASADALRTLAHAQRLILSRALLEEREQRRDALPWKQRLAAWIEDTERKLRLRYSGPASHWIPDALRFVLAHMQLTLAFLAERRGEDRFMALRKKWSPAVPQLNMTVCAGVATDKRKRVLMALHWLELGGAEKFAVDLVERLPRDKYAIYVTTDVPSLNPWQARIAARAEEVVHLPSFLPRWHAAAFLDHFIRTRRIDLLHIHHSAWAYESLPVLRRFHPALPVLDTLHIIELPPSPGGYPEWACRNFEPLIDCHHVISNHLRDFLSQRWAVRADKIRRIYLNVDTERFAPDKVPRGSFRSAHGIADGERLVAFVGRLARQKRPEQFVEMASRLLLRAGRDVPLRFVVAGSGPLEEDVRQRVSVAGAERSFLFTGEIADPRALYRDADAVALCSENEGLALVTYEAMAMGTPVVSTDVGAQSELVPPELLVAADGPVGERMADTLWELLRDPARLASLGRQGRERILAGFTADRTYAEIEALYQELLAG
jgi:glycosyltransferase involved in cell wall biosynthesis